MNYSLNFPYAFGEPNSSAFLKSHPEDFVVDEIFSFQAAREGEHLYLHLKKTGENTQYLADALADYFKINKMDVGVAGMKDRNAITSQWFSCYLPGGNQDFNLAAFKAKFQLNVDLLEQVRHTQKLRRGEHQGNTFQIYLRGISKSEETEQRLQTIKKEGVPNYFGVQRFGHEGSNLVQFEEKVQKEISLKENRRPKSKNKQKKGRNTNSMLVSAARSYLFNIVLAERVRQHNWQHGIEGDVLKDQLPTGPLWGRGRELVTDEALALEKKELEPLQHWRNSLEHSGLQQERRALKLNPQNFSWFWEEASLKLTFQLKPGEYATTVLREICILQNA